MSIKKKMLFKRVALIFLTLIFVNTLQSFEEKIEEVLNTTTPRLKNNNFLLLDIPGTHGVFAKEFFCKYLKTQNTNGLESIELSKRGEILDSDQRVVSAQIPLFELNEASPEHHRNVISLFEHPIERFIQDIAYKKLWLLQNWDGLPEQTQQDWMFLKTEEEISTENLYKLLKDTPAHLTYFQYFRPRDLLETPLELEEINEEKVQTTVLHALEKVDIFLLPSELRTSPFKALHPTNLEKNDAFIVFNPPKYENPFSEPATAQLADILKWDILFYETILKAKRLKVSLPSPEEGSHFMHILPRGFDPEVYIALRGEDSFAELPEEGIERTKTALQEYARDPSTFQKVKTVITFGTYDLFHIGHLNILKRAKKLGDRLVVGVSSDTFNYIKKRKYPVCDQDQRMAIVQAIEGVDEVFLEESFEKKKEYVERYNADILVMGDDWKGRFNDISESCRTCYLPRTQDISTTDLIATISKAPKRLDVAPLDKYIVSPGREKYDLGLYQLLKDVQEAFQKCRVNYFAIAGTLLGSTRHGGLIPWDDDLDLAVTDDSIESVSQAGEILRSLGYEFLPLDYEFQGWKIQDTHKYPAYSDSKKETVYPFCDIFLIKKEDSKYIFPLGWPDYYFEHDEIYPLKRGYFGTLNIPIPNAYPIILDKNFKKPEQHRCAWLRDVKTYNHSFGLTGGFCRELKAEEYLPAGPFGPLEDRVI